MKVGMGVYPPEHMEEILEARNRQAAGPTAPARGLTLISMEYEKELRPVIAGENKHWSYRLIQTEVLEKKQAYLVIGRCEDEFFDALLMRVSHQAVRNGARRVYAADLEGERNGKSRIQVGKDYGYYQFTEAGENVLVPVDNWDQFLDFEDTEWTGKPFSPEWFLTEGIIP